MIWLDDSGNFTKCEECGKKIPNCQKLCRECDERRKEIEQRKLKKEIIIN